MPLPWVSPGMTTIHLPLLRPRIAFGETGRFPSFYPCNGLPPSDTEHVAFYFYVAVIRVGTEDNGDTYVPIYVISYRQGTGVNIDVLRVDFLNLRNRRRITFYGAVCRLIAAVEFFVVDGTGFVLDVTAKYADI